MLIQRVAIDKTAAHVRREDAQRMLTPIDLHDSVDERLVEGELGVVVQRSEFISQQLGTELNADIREICLSNIVSCFCNGNVCN